MKDSWLFPHRDFSVAAFLQRIRSPRLQDMPDLARWIDEAARANDLRAEWLCAVIEKEQTGLRKRTLSQHAQDWLCGYGWEEGGVVKRQFEGARNQVYSAARGLRRYLTPGDSLYVGGWVGKPRTFDGETRTVRNLAEACALQYTPHWSTLATMESLWREFGFEDGEATMPARLSPPLKVGPAGFGLRYNTTLHGRSVYRSQDVPGHNVFKGYSTWEGNGHRGVGDALDCFAPAWTPVYAMHDGVQTVWRNDTSKLEVIYIEGGGVTTVYAHIDASYEGTGVPIRRGQHIGRVRGDLNDPHLHLEVWVDGSAVAAKTPGALAAKLMALCAEPAVPKPFRVEVLGQYLDADDAYEKDGETWVKLRPVAEIAGWELQWKPNLNKVFAKLRRA